MSKVKEIKDLESYEAAKKRLELFCDNVKPGPEDVVAVLKDLISMELVNASHSERLAYELENMANALGEVYQKISHSFSSLTALMHYLKDVGVTKNGKLDIEKYKEVFTEKIVKPYAELQNQIENLEQKASPFGDDTFGAPEVNEPPADEEPPKENN